GVDQVLARVASGGTAYWLLTDRLGSVRDVTNTSGVVKDHLGYDGFGNVTTETDPAYTFNVTWTGRERDGETGLQYNHDRYYDPPAARWLTEDPSGLGAGDTNLYLYAYNEPTDLTDASGLMVALTSDQWDGPTPQQYQAAGQAQPASSGNIFQRGCQFVC